MLLTLVRSLWPTGVCACVLRGNAGCRCPAGANCTKSILVQVTVPAGVDNTPPAVATPARRLAEETVAATSDEIVSSVGVRWPRELPEFWVGPVRASVYNSDECRQLRAAKQGDACPDGWELTGGDGTGSEALCGQLPDSLATDDRLFECFEGAEFYPCRTALACPGGGTRETTLAGNSSCRDHHTGVLCDTWCVEREACVRVWVVVR